MKHPHSGLSFSKTEYEDVAKLVNRVAPNLARFLQSYYPQEYLNPKSIDDPTPILEEPPSDQHPQSPLTAGERNTQDTQDRPLPLRISLPTDRLNSYRERMDELANNMVLAHITGRNSTSKYSFHKRRADYTRCRNMGTHWKEGT